ncbi:hypothetical protein LJC48_00690 [Desulfovibrio sp. OttesenSCG-928-C06]|nr:hypothetical protein [Desulfovibrio sp. OttesenSCG-928-C06]
MSNIEHIFKIKAGFDGLRLDAALGGIYPDYGLRARRRIWEWCEVRVDGIARKPSYKVREGQEVEIRRLKDGVQNLNATGMDDFFESSGTATAPGADSLPEAFGSNDVPERLPDMFPGDLAVSEAFEPGAKTPEMLASIGNLLGEPDGDALRNGAFTKRVPGPSCAPSPRFSSAAQKIDFTGFVPEIVAAGRDFVAFSKPGGIASASLSGGGSQSMEELIARHWREVWLSFVTRNPQDAEAVCSARDCGANGSDIPPRPTLCNRLDADTSGLLLGAFDSEGVALFRQYERDGKARKKYLALAHGIAPQYMLMDKTLDTYKRKTTLVLPHSDLDYTRHTRAVLLKTFETPDEVEADVPENVTVPGELQCASSQAGPVSPQNSPLASQSASQPVSRSDLGNSAILAGQAMPDRLNSQDSPDDAGLLPELFDSGASGDAGDVSQFARSYADGILKDDSVMAGLRYLVSLTGPLSLMELTILRGARHQIRAHLANAALPIVGDTQYGLESTSRAGRMFLHHFEISLPGFRAEVAPDWRIVLE